MLTDYDEAALPNSIFTCFRITDEECCTKFFDHLFHVNYHGQQKIADCLSSLDDLIAAEDKKLEVLKTHKKA